MSKGGFVFLSVKESRFTPLSPVLTTTKRDSGDSQIDRSHNCPLKIPISLVALRQNYAKGGKHGYIPQTW